jgi:hypothetical protein
MSRTDLGGSTRLLLFDHQSDSYVCLRCAAHDILASRDT